MQFVYIACPLGSRPSASLEIFSLSAKVGKRLILSFEAKEIFSVVVLHAYWN